jgi:hypothetical protein
MGPTASLPLRRKACWGFFRRLRPGVNPQTWVPKASTVPLDHWSRSTFTYSYSFNTNTLHKYCDTEVINSVPIRPTNRWTDTAKLVSRQLSYFDFWHAEIARKGYILQGTLYVQDRKNLTDYLRWHNWLQILCGTGYGGYSGDTGTTRTMFGQNSYLE